MGVWLESEFSVCLWLSLALAKPNNINEHAGAELCQAQFKLGLAMPTYWVSCLAKLTTKLPYFILGQCYTRF